MKEMAINAKQEDTLCMSCGKACGACSWSKELIPVDGWTANKTRNGFMVRECPEYKADGDDRGRPENFDTDGCIELLKAVGSRMRSDYMEGIGPCPRDYMHPETVQETVRRNRITIEKFLRSKYGKRLMMLTNPDEVIDRLREMAAKYDMAESGDLDDLQVH